MTTYIISAFFIGALGSTHCIGMCGPIALSLPSVRNTLASRFITSLLYNLGRILTYSFIGLIVGFIGQSFFVLGLQKVLSMLLGLLVLSILLFPYININFEKVIFINKGYKNIRKLIYELFNKKNNYAILLIGLLNGLLPCGLIYIASIGAASTNSPMGSVIFMISFGLGTLPLLWAFSFFGQFVRVKLYKVFKFTYPIILFTMACLLILRGLGINIFMEANKTQLSSHSTLMECHN